jgi:hypothetical protein
MNKTTDQILKKSQRRQQLKFGESMWHLSFQIIFRLTRLAMFTTQKK